MIGWVMDGWIEEFLVVFFSLSFITFVSYLVLFQNLTTHLKVGRFLFSYVCIDCVFGIPGGPKKTIHILEVLPTDATTCKCFRHFGALSIYIFRQESAVLSILEHFCQIDKVLPEGISFSKPAKFLLTSVMLILLGSAFSLANCHRRSCNCVACFL